MFVVYVSKTLKGKNTFIGMFKNLWDAVDCGANHPGMGYFAIQNIETGEFVDLDKV